MAFKSLSTRLQAHEHHYLWVISGMLVNVFTKVRKEKALSNVGRTDMLATVENKSGRKRTAATCLQLVHAPPEGEKVAEAAHPAPVAPLGLVMWEKKRLFLFHTVRMLIREPVTNNRKKG
jgi:hypothetical protein